MMVIFEGKMRVLTIGLNSRAAPILKFPPIPIPMLRYSPVPIPTLPIPQITDTFADTDTFRYIYF